MPIRATPPQDRQEDPNQPGAPPQPLMFEEFAGIDTMPLRPGVDDRQMAWCDGFIPLARMHLRTLPGVGDPIWVGPTGSITPPASPGGGGGGGGSGGGGSTSGFVTIYLTTVGDGTWPVPADFDPTNNTVEVIAGGGGGGRSPPHGPQFPNLVGLGFSAGGGGAGGGYAKSSNVVLTAGGMVAYHVGVGGAAGGGAGGHTTFGTFVAAPGGAGGGAGLQGSGGGPGAGGLAPATTDAAFIGATKSKGGNGGQGGGTPANGGGGGGGGAGGSAGAGNAGAVGGGTAGGVGGSGDSGSGGLSDHAGTNWDTTHGSGGGGSGGASRVSGKIGGAYGAGGGGGGCGGASGTTGGAGFQGIIRIQYKSTTSTPGNGGNGGNPPPVTPPVNNPSEAVIFFDFGNIGATPIMIVVLANGAIYSVNTQTKAITLMAPAGTILNPSLVSMGMTQWGNQYIILVADQPDGFFLWDGTNFMRAGSLGPDILLQSSGRGYTSPPTITAYGGSGSGATFTAQISSGFIVGISLTNPGSGYKATDAVGLAFSGGGITQRSAILTTAIANGTISAVNIVDGGAGYHTLTSASLVGGGGIGGSITLGVTTGAISATTIVNAGAAYVTAPTILVQDASQSVAVAQVDVMPFGVQGTAVETFQQRVWVAHGSFIFFTSPGTVVDFSTVDGGGFFRSSDSYLRVRYTSLRVANAFLYLIGDSSINYISQVSTGGTPLTTVFQNQNADPEVGTPYPATVDVIDRALVMANSIGAYVVSGSNAKKISRELNGVYNTVPNFGGKQLSATKCVVFGYKLWLLLVPIIDPVSKQQVNKLFVWDATGQQKWSSTEQDVPLIHVQHQEIDSVLTAYGTDGQFIYPLFQRPSIHFAKTVQSKLWAQPMGYWEEKAAVRLWGLVHYYSSDAPDIIFTIDNEFDAPSVETSSLPVNAQWLTQDGQPATWFDAQNAISVWTNDQSETQLALSGGQRVTVGPPSVHWKNDIGLDAIWTNQSGQEATWTTTGLGVIDPTAVGQQGVLLGMTFTTLAADLAIVSVALQTELVGYRG